MTITATIPDCFVSSRQFYYILFDVDGRMITANRFFIETFGLNNNVSEKNIFTLFSDSDSKINVKEITEETKSSQDKRTSFTLKNPNHFPESIYIKWEVSCLNGNTNNQMLFQAIGTTVNNVTEDNALLRFTNPGIFSGNKLFENLLINNVDIILVVDSSCLITFCSPNITRELGYSPDEIIGKLGFDFINLEDLNEARNIFESELNQPDRNESVDIRLRKKDGTWLWMEAKGKNLLNDPHVNGIIINLNNIHTRKAAECSLQKSETRYRSFFETLPYPLFVLDSNCGKIIDFNKSAIEKYGYSNVELSQMRFTDLFAEHPEIKDLEELCRKQILVRHLNKNGDIIIAKLEKYNTDLGNSENQLVLVQDITESYNRQQESQLTYDISSVLMENRPIQQSLEKALQKIRKITGWDLIELWSPVYDHSFIKNNISAFYKNHPQESIIDRFIKQTRLNQYSKDQYSKVPAYKNQKPHWIELLGEDDSLVRKKIAQEAGFKSILAIPVVNDGVVVCSLYLFSFHEKKRNENSEKLIQTLGSLIGLELEKRKRELELELFFKISPEVMTIAGMDGKYLKVNPAFERFIGYTEKEAKQFKPFHYIHKEDKAVVSEKFKELLKGKSVLYFENRVVTKSGEVKWISWSATPLADEGIFIATHRDITDKKEFEQQLRLINERYEYVTKATSNEAIWDLDLLTNEITWSEVFSNMFGYSHLKGDATIDFWESKLHKDDKKRVQTSFNEFITQSNTTNWYCEYRFERADGSFAYIVDKGYMIFNDNKQPIRVVGSMEDISERKKLELELIFKERTKQKQIAQAAVNAQEKERADVGRELHDNISQMLTSTKLFLEILNKKSPDEMLERSVKNINTIIAEVRNITRSLVPAGIEELGLIASLHDLLDNIKITNIIDLEFFPDITVENVINSNYKLTLYRIVQEQINNIVKHASASHVIVELFQEGNNIELIMTDNGQGFDLNTIKKGHGLKNMRSRAELINGTIEIITSPGKGCKLKVNIPCQ